MALSDRITELASRVGLEIKTVRAQMSAITGGATVGTVTSVNGVQPDADGNVAVAIASVRTGTLAAIPAAAASAEGDVYVVSGDATAANNGRTYIFKPGAGWLEISGLDTAGNDARYVNASGDTMTGPLVLPANPTLAMQAATKSYVDGRTSLKPILRVSHNPGQYIDSSWRTVAMSKIEKNTFPVADYDIVNNSLRYKGTGTAQVSYNAQLGFNVVGADKYLNVEIVGADGTSVVDTVSAARSENNYVTLYASGVAELTTGQSVRVRAYTAGWFTTIVNNPANWAAYHLVMTEIGRG